jgi:phosphodiesterase/alkaline phosphatase D-like protein
MSEYDSSSTLPEIKQRRKQLQYRRDWLEALQDETIRELKILFQVEELTEEHEPDIVVSDGDILQFVNQMSNVLLDFEQQMNTPEEIKQRQEQLQYYRACFQYLLDDTLRELTILGEIVQSLSEESLNTVNQA